MPEQQELGPEHEASQARGPAARLCRQWNQSQEVDQALTQLRAQGKHPYILRPILNMSKSLFSLLMSSVFFPASWKKNTIFVKCPVHFWPNPCLNPPKKNQLPTAQSNFTKPDSRFRVWAERSAEGGKFLGVFPKVPSNSSLSRPPLRSSSYFLVGMAR